MPDGTLLDAAWAGTGAAVLADDRAVLAALVDVEVALAQALAELGLVPDDAARRIAVLAGPDRDHIDVRAVVDGVRASGNPVVALVGALRTLADERHPGDGAFVHLGATSQDVLDTALMLVAARTLDRVLVDLDRCAASLAELAAAHRDTPMVARTLTQHAVPTTFGLKAAGWRDGVLGARHRLELVRGTLPVSVAGAGGTLAATVEHARLAGDADPEATAMALPARLATRLGLASTGLPWHGVRLPIADLAAGLATTTGALGKVAADVLVLARPEIDEVAEGRAPGRGGSSAMPQKHNPVRATEIATAARRLPALASILFAAMVTEDERSAGAWHAEWPSLREALLVTAGAATNAAELLAGLDVHPERMRATLGDAGDAVTSERVVAVLGARIGPGEARAVVAAGASADALRAELVARGHDVPDDLAEILDPTGYTGAAGALVDRHLGLGGASTSDTSPMIDGR